MTKVSPKDIDAILPQTQCGLCGHGGCMPYATALIEENAAINLCPPGGVPVLRQIASLLQRNSAPFEQAMQETAKSPTLAVIRENECIGCTKCIQVCPVDAILGSAKSMHSVINKECTGCELCVPACPVDCIDMITIPAYPATNHHFRERFLAREKRLALSSQQHFVNEREKSDNERKDYLAEVLKRTQAR